MPWEKFGDPWSTDPNPPSGLALPIDAQDACYMEHDRCYARARNPKNNGKCSSTQQSGDDATCDEGLMSCLAGVNSSGGPANNIASQLGQIVFSIKELIQ